MHCTHLLHAFTRYDHAGGSSSGFTLVQRSDAMYDQTHPLQLSADSRVYDHAGSASYNPRAEAMYDHAHANASTTYELARAVADYEDCCVDGTRITQHTVYHHHHRQHRHPFNHTAYSIPPLSRFNWYQTDQDLSCVLDPAPSCPRCKTRISIKR